MWRVAFDIPPTAREVTKTLREAGYRVSVRTATMKSQEVCVLFKTDEEAQAALESIRSLITTRYPTVVVADTIWPLRRYEGEPPSTEPGEEDRIYNNAVVAITIPSPREKLPVKQMIQHLKDVGLYDQANSFGFGLHIYHNPTTVKFAMYGAATRQSKAVADAVAKELQDAFHVDAQVRESSTFRGTYWSIIIKKPLTDMWRQAFEIASEVGTVVTTLDEFKQALQPYQVWQSSTGENANFLIMGVHPRLSKRVRTVEYESKFWEVRILEAVWGSVPIQISKEQAAHLDNDALPLTLVSRDWTKKGEKKRIEELIFSG